MKKIILFAAIVICGTSLSFGQARKTNSKVADKWEVYGGYTFTRLYGDPNLFSVTSSTDNEFAPYNVNGAQVAASYFPKNNLGLTYEMNFTTTGDRKINASTSTYYTQNTTAQEYVIGPTYRYQLKNGRWKNTTLFAHQLFGATHESLSIASYSTSASAFTTVSGGGVDFKLKSHISVRPAQLEYVSRHLPMSIFSSDPETQSVKFGENILRYSAGVTFNF